MALIIAHRGARSLAPENTLAAARKALAVGADLWETDVMVTRDGELILFHDDSLVRTTDVKDRFPGRDPWRVAMFTLDEIRVLDAGSWFLEDDPFGMIVAEAVTGEELSGYKGERIPTLAEGLHFTRDVGFRVNLELKRLSTPLGDFPLVERVLKAIDDAGIGYEHFVVSSFNHEWLRDIRARNPSLEIQALVSYAEIRSLDWENPEFATYNLRSTLIDEARIQAMREKGIAINLFTVNEADEMLRFAKAGAAGLITDFPQRAENRDTPPFLR